MNKKKNSSIVDMIIELTKASPVVSVAIAIIVVIIAIPVILNLFSKLLTVPPTTAQINLSDTIMSTLSARAQLISAEETIRDLPIRINITGGVANSLGYGATYETDIVVKVGFNFVREGFQVVKIDDTHLKIQLPQIEILSCSMSPVQDIDRSTSLTADWDNAKELAEYMLMRQAVRETIDNQELEELGKANARNTINDIIAPIDPDIKLTYEFLDSDNTLIDDTCVVRQPLLWSYDEENDVWEKG